MLKRALAKVLSVLFQSNRTGKLYLVSSRVPQFEAVIARLTSGNATGVTSHPWRAIDILKILDTHRPTVIVELGGGSSTALFADYVGRTAGATLFSVDESKDWMKLTAEALEKADLLPNDRVELVAVKRIESTSGSYYDIELPNQIDLLYIDGPSIQPSPDGGKLANQDVVLLLNRGILPRTIVVDGRHATVDAVRQHPSGAKYRFTPGSDYFISKVPGNFLHLRKLGQLHRHCLFEMTEG